MPRHHSNLLHAFPHNEMSPKRPVPADVVLHLVQLLTTKQLDPHLLHSDGRRHKAIAKLRQAPRLQLLNTYKVTFTAAVPTVWLMLLRDLENRRQAAVPEASCDAQLHLPARDSLQKIRLSVEEVIHAWGRDRDQPGCSFGSAQ